MVSVLAVYSDDPCSNPAEDDSFSVKLNFLKYEKISKTRQMLAHKSSLLLKPVKVKVDSESTFNPTTPMTSHEGRMKYKTKTFH